MSDLNDHYYEDGTDDVLAVYVNNLLASTLRSEYKNIELLAAQRQLLDADKPLQVLDGDGSDWDVLLPPADLDENHPFLLVNGSGGSEVLTIKSNDETVTHAVLRSREYLFVLPDGTGTYVTIGKPFGRVLTPSQVTANQNDWFPTGAGSVDVLRISTDASREFTGFGFPAAYKTILVVNSGSNPAVFKNESASSVAANRFSFGADLTLATLQTVMMWYDPTSARWRVVGGGGSGGTSVDDVRPYKIVASVTSNNLTVAIKDKDGNDPSVSSPVRVQIGDTVREVTAALSLTLNAGTNFFDAGSTAHNAQDIDFPVHLIWRAASSEVLLGLSRGFGRIYSDFSSTSTDPYYLAYSGSAPASTDVIENIGSINASLSATPSFNWSIPATPVINHKPIVATRVMTWNPNPTGYSSLPTANFARYQVRNDKKISMNYRMAVGGATSNSTSLTFTLPFRARTITNALWQVFCNVINNGVALTTPGRCAWSSGATSADVFIDSASGAWTSSGEKRIGGMQITEYEY